MITKLFYSLETTGTDPRRHSIYEINGLMEVDDVVKEKIKILTKPHPKCLYEEGVLERNSVTLEQLNNYPDMNISHKEFKAILGKYVDPYDPKDKIHLVGYSNKGFDDVFLEKWFLQNKDEFFRSWFWVDTLDTMVLASQYLLNRRQNMTHFTMKCAALELGILVPDEIKGENKVQLIREIYRIVTGLEIEI